MTKEEILNNSSIFYELEKPNNYNLNYVRGLILEAMEEYARENLREELIKFAKDFDKNHWTKASLYLKVYLKQKL